jgi:hypothetical protein
MSTLMMETELVSDTLVSGQKPTSIIRVDVVNPDDGDRAILRNVGFRSKTNVHHQG